MIIRKLTEFDLPFLLEVRNDDTTRMNLKNDSIFTLQECNEWFFKTNPIWYIIEVDGNGVGYLRTEGNVIGCDIHPNYRRKGYARAAYKKYLEQTHISKLELDVFEDNHAKKLYEELGFKETGQVEFIRGRKYLKMIYENRN